MGAYAMKLKSFQNGYNATVDSEVRDEPELTGDYSEELIDKLNQDCEEFVRKHGALFNSDHAYIAGVCFWHNRNGSGTGFWDRPELFGIDAAEALNKAAQEFGEFYIYTGDDGLLYGS